MNLDDFNLGDFNPNAFPGTPGNLLATLLQLGMFNTAAVQVILRNQAELAHKLGATGDVDQCHEAYMKEVLETMDKIQDNIWRKGIQGEE